MSRSIDYGNLMHRAMRGLIQDVLNDVRDNGLPGALHQNNPGHSARNGARIDLSHMSRKNELPPGFWS